MHTVDKNMKMLLEAVKNTDVYKDYREQAEILNRDPLLRERVDHFRAANFRLQNETGNINLFQATDQLRRESAELRRIPEVNAYLDAELALCKMMQNICEELIDGIDIHVPEL